MRELASIQKIIAINPIEGADQIELADVQGWHVIVRKEENYKVGDLIIYIQYDTILPVKPEFEFLRDCCYSKKFNGFRIKNRKLRGVFSEGIVFPLSIIDDGFHNWKEGDDVSELLGVQKYDLEVLEEVKKKKHSKLYMQMMRYKWFRTIALIGKRKQKKGSYPEYIQKSDEDNIQVVFDELKPKNLFYNLTEKLEGQSATFEVTNKKKFVVYSHNIRFGKRDNSNYWNTAIKFNIENKMKKFMKLHKIKAMAIQGEIIGEGIQKNPYKIIGKDFYIFNIRDTEKKLDFNLDDTFNFCKETELKYVPLLDQNVQLPDTVDEVLEKAEGMSILKKDQMREGIVWRCSNANPKISFKAKSKAYQSWFNKKDKTK